MAHFYEIIFLHHYMDVTGGRRTQRILILSKLRTLCQQAFFQKSEQSDLAVSAAGLQHCSIIGARITW